MKLTVCFAGCILIGLIIFVAIIKPNFVRSPRSPLNTIIYNLDQIDSAKQFLAAIYGITNEATAVSVEGVQSFLNRFKMDPFSRPVAGERYSVNPLFQPPEAVLTKSLRLRRGTAFETNFATGSTIRLTTNGGWEVLPPTSDQ